MRLAILGATGRTGRLLVQQALDDGHEVTAFIREPGRLGLTHERLRVVAGDVHDPVPVERAVAGADVVLNALGHVRGSPRDLQTIGARHALEAMGRHGVRRLVSQTEAGLRDPRDPPSLGARVLRLMQRLVARNFLADAERHAALIRASGVDWVIVRAPRLVEGPRTGRYRAGYMRLGPRARISRADCADFMLRQVTGDTFLGQAPMISY